MKPVSSKKTIARKHADGARKATVLKVFLRTRREMRLRFLSQSKRKAVGKSRNIRALGRADIRPFCKKNILFSLLQKLKMCPCRFEVVLEDLSRIGGHVVVG